MSTGIKVVYGGGSFWSNPELRTPAALETILAQLEAHGVTTIDTARVYEGSEETLGAGSAASRFTLDTKAPAGYGASAATRAQVAADARTSAELLGGGPVDVFYLHNPDGRVAIEETLAGVDDVFRSGFFRRFGLSNFSAADVQAIYDLCAARGYPLPRVYQGRYGPMERADEAALLPTLRRLGIAFYAYSPVAGGLLAKSKAEVLAGKGRFSRDSWISRAFFARYAKPEYLDVLDTWARIAADEGVSRAELAYRWVRYSSALRPELGDAVILGASSHAQLAETLDGIDKGPLSEQAVRAIDEFYKDVQERVAQAALEQGD